MGKQGASFAIVLVAALSLARLRAEEAPPKPLSSTELGKLVERYVKGDAAERTKVLDEMGDRDALKAKADVDKWQKTILAELGKKGPKAKPVPTNLLEKLDEKRRQMNKSLGLSTAPVATIESPIGPVRAMIINDKAPANSPVVAALHGGGNTGSHPGELDNEMAWGWQLKRTGLMQTIPFRVIPRCADDKATNSWILTSEVQGVDATLDTVARTYSIDPDRVYLTGTSMGGFGAWTFAAVEADRFAAVASLCGACTVKEKSLANLRNLDFGVFIGDKDAGFRLEGSRKGRDWLQALKAKDAEGYSLQYKEYPGVDHALNDGVYKDVGEYLKSKVRQSYPKVVVWNPLVPWKTRFYNIGIASPGDGMSVRMEIAKDNKVTVTSSGVPALTVYFNPKLVDLQKPVEVSWNGKSAFTGNLDQRLSVMLETLGDRGDAGMYYTAKVVLSEK